MPAAYSLLLFFANSVLAAPFPAWPLQLSCATQEARERGDFLAHGSFVFRDLYDHTRVAYFQTSLAEERYHPFCDRLGAALREERWLKIDTRSLGGIEILVGIEEGERFEF